MRILNFGSLNIDYVYRVPHIARPGETLASVSFQTFPGGKGANQSVALALAGAEVFHAGKVGQDGEWLLDKLASFGIDTQFVRVSDGTTGHAIIQVDDEGQNSIVLYAGSNKQISREEIDEVFRHFVSGDILLLQNEINEVSCLIESGHKIGMKVCLNPAPYTPEAASYPLHLIDILFVNETEGMGLAGVGQPDSVLSRLADMMPRAEILMTLGADGVAYHSPVTDVRVPAPKVTAVDTTAAGDTFIGYCLAGYAAGRPVQQCLETACRAASLCVTRKGAMDSIPRMDEVME